MIRFLWGIPGGKLYYDGGCQSVVIESEDEEEVVSVPVTALPHLISAFEWIRQNITAYNDQDLEED